MMLSDIVSPPRYINDPFITSLTRNRCVYKSIYPNSAIIPITFQITNPIVKIPLNLGRPGQRRRRRHLCVPAHKLTFLRKRFAVGEAFKLRSRY